MSKRTIYRRSIEPASPAAYLEVDLDALRANCALRAAAPRAVCAGVVKADAYGLGLAPVARVLVEEGCTVFFTASLDEAMALRPLVGPAPTIAVLNGYLDGQQAAFLAHDLSPVLNDPGQLARRQAECKRLNQALPAFLHIDTGMSRLGLSAAELDRLVERTDAFSGPRWQAVMSHFACADVPEHPLNRRQARRFLAARAKLPEMPASFANSAAVLSAPGTHFDLVRPGIALYGGAALVDRPTPMRPVVRGLAPVLQVRQGAPGETIGYGATASAPHDMAIALVAAGYADGYPRAASNRGQVAIGARLAPIIGRVSMDMLAVDLSGLPPGAVAPGDMVEVLGPRATVDAAADSAETIANDVLTSLGHRYQRRFLGATAEPRR